MRARVCVCVKTHPKNISLATIQPRVKLILILLLLQLLQLMLLLLALFVLTAGLIIHRLHPQHRGCSLYDLW